MSSRRLRTWGKRPETLLVFGHRSWMVLMLPHMEGHCRTQGQGCSTKQRPARLCLQPLCKWRQCPLWFTVSPELLGTPGRQRWAGAISFPYQSSEVPASRRRHTCRGSGQESLSTTAQVSLARLGLRNPASPRAGLRFPGSSQWLRLLASASHYFRGGITWDFGPF